MKNQIDKIFVEIYLLKLWEIEWCEGQFYLTKNKIFKSALSPEDEWEISTRRNW